MSKGINVCTEIRPASWLKGIDVGCSCRVPTSWQAILSLADAKSVTV